MSSNASKKRAASVPVESVQEKKSKSELNGVVFDEKSLQVKIQYFPKKEEEDYEEIKEEGKQYIDVYDDDETEHLVFENLGFMTDYECTRRGNARVFLNGRIIGSIHFTIIGRDYFGRNTNFWEACDAESGEMERIASKFFERNGSIKKSLRRHLNNPSSAAMANDGSFMFIQSIELDKPYDKMANDENVRVAAAAISKLVDSAVHCNDGITTTLVMYIPDGSTDESRRKSSPKVLSMDMRQFSMAGFGHFHDKHPDCTYMFKELRDDGDDNDVLSSEDDKGLRFGGDDSEDDSDDEDDDDRSEDNSEDGDW